jgi:hypothetical protein
MLPSLAGLSQQTTLVSGGWYYLDKDLQDEIVTRLHQDDIKREVRDVIALCIVDHTLADYCRDDLLFEALLAQHNMGGHAALYGLKSKVYYQLLGGLLWSLTSYHIKQLVAIANGKQTIERETFKGCTSLKLTSLPVTLVTIEDGAFHGCTSLALTLLPPELATIGYGAFYKCTSLALTWLPPKLTMIGSGVFRGCTSLALESLPETLVKLGGWAFDGCTKLVVTSLPETLVVIEDRVFGGCTLLALKSLPPKLTMIGDSAFCDCTSLALKSLPPNLTEIGGGAFKGCTSLSPEIRRAILEINPNAI